jgi:AcrR family transcriptional regulator
MPAVAPSTKEQLVRTAERLLAERGLEGVSLREIGAAAGNGNNSAVQYHFGSKDQLIQAIVEYRLVSLHERRRVLLAQRCPDDLRSWLECYVLPLLEQAEQQDSHYLTFVAMLLHHGRTEVFERLPAERQAATRTFLERVPRLLAHVVEPLRTHRITQATAFVVHAASDRERARANRQPVLPLAVYVNDLLDGLVGFLTAPVSPAALAALEGTDPSGLGFAALPVISGPAAPAGKKTRTTNSRRRRRGGEAGDARPDTKRPRRRGVRSERR